MKVLVAYGTLTMNTEIVAEKVYETALMQDNVSEVDLQNVADISEVTELENYDVIIFGLSTWGEGDYNPDTEEFVMKLEDENPKLSNKKIAIFGLGETSYDNFCGAAIIFQELLQTSYDVAIIGDMLKIDGFPDDDVLRRAEEWTESIFAHM